jgi:hypothetical protein
MTITTTDEFRPIPGFKKYQISRDGDVRNARTGKALRESLDMSNGSYKYTLAKDGGGHTSRNYRGLVELAWGDA